MGTDVFSTGESASCVTNASLNETVGVTVSVTVSNTNASGVFVDTVGTGEGVGETPLRGVGVEYCPHRDVFPPQEARKKEATKRKTIHLCKMSGPLMRIISVEKFGCRSLLTSIPGSNVIGKSAYSTGSTTTIKFKITMLSRFYLSCSCTCAQCCAQVLDSG
jgi:hypothetical protein